jgi:hypothetical protein
MRELLHHAPAAFDRPNPESSLSATGPISDIPPHNVDACLWPITDVHFQQIT